MTLSYRCSNCGEELQTTNADALVASRVDLGYEINQALSAFLDATDRATKEIAEFKLREILWDNKAGIVAHLLS